VATLQDVAARRTDLGRDDVDWLHHLVADWQLLADLSFADLVLWLPLSGRAGFVAVAQMRPTTGPTAHHDDVVGSEVPRGRRPQLDLAVDERRICRERDPDWPGDVPVREETIPVVRAGNVVAVLSRHTNLAAARTPSRLELTYLRTADDLARMVAQGRFPVADQAPRVAHAPRVGDGLIRLDESGVVTFASPNAVSAYRRLGHSGDLVGVHLGDVTARLAAGGPSGRAGLAGPPVAVDEALSMVVSGWAARETEVEVGGTALRLRVIPLVPDGVRTAALVLCRDVSEIRRGERELVGKDTAIREIHHRVKNNLQTVAALLRLQSRRLGEHDHTAREALQEAERRVGSIAVVHETLARAAEDAVDFDEVADRVVGMVGALGSGGSGAEVRVRRSGSFGLLGPEVATPLALVLVELVQNAVEHGLADRGGEVVVSVRHTRPDTGRATLALAVEDGGAGLPPGFDLERDAGLGLQIVRTLVEGELGGSLRVGPGGEPAAEGTRAEVLLPGAG
jgi:two-component sensor histidine kinase